MGMNFELMVLAAASLWGFLQLVAAAQAANAQYGLKWAASPRDIEMPPLKPLPGRINRNFRNYMETFPFFAAAVLTAQAAGVHNEVTHWGSIAYSAGASLTPRLTYPECRSSARCSGTSPPLACSQFWRRPSCRAEASGGTPARVGRHRICQRRIAGQITAPQRPSSAQLHRPWRAAIRFCTTLLRGVRNGRITPPTPAHGA